MPEQTNAMTIDVEDYYQVAAFGKNISRSDWPRFESRSVANTEKILDFFEKQNIKATFFILGYEAQRNPGLVQKIVAAGHEIASHGLDHQLIYTQNEDVFRNDVKTARKILQDLSGQEVLAYRAPSFSITPKTPWAHRILVEEGYCYDSSVFPVRHDLYGNPNASREIHRIETESGSIIEFPPTVVKIGGISIPTGGGGYFRLFPFWLTKYLLKQVNRKRPFVFYLHPWEIDPNQPRIPNVSWKSKFRHYINLHKTASRLERILTSFSFTTMGEVLQEWAKADK